MQKAASELKPGQIFNDGKHDDVQIDLAYEAGTGLGIVVKGRHIDDGMPYFHRFLDPNEMVEVRE